MGILGDKVDRSKGLLGGLAKVSNAINNNEALQMAVARQRGENPAAVMNAFARKRLMEEAAQRRQALEQQKAEQMAREKALVDRMRAAATPKNAHLFEGYDAGVFGAKDVMAGMHPGAKDRKTMEDRHGVPRYMDTGEQVFREVRDAPEVRDQAEVFDFEKKLRGEFQSITKDFRKQQQAFGRILSSAGNASPAGDLALIFNYMKVLDPTSTVRESEYQSVADASKWLEESEKSGVAVPLPVARGIRKLQTGELLSDDQRRDFFGSAAGMYEESAKGFEERRRQYTGLSEQYKLTPDRVVISDLLYPKDSYADMFPSSGDGGGGLTPEEEAERLELREKLKRMSASGEGQ